MGKIAVRQADLPNHITERAGEPPPEDGGGDQEDLAVPDISTPVTLLALVVPATILLANVISIGPAVTAMRTRPASVLREE